MLRKGTQIHNDKNLLKFSTYEDYLGSLVTPLDCVYLRNTETCRRIAELGYRSTGDTLNRKDFEIRRDLAKNLLFPIWKPFTLDSELPVNFKHPLQVELALRERSNRLGTLSTVIFIRKSTKLMFEVSGYIDYAKRLKQENFKSFFLGEKLLSPRPNDLAYYHWKNEKVMINKSENWDVVVDSRKGLILKNFFDRKFLYLNPDYYTGINTTRSRIVTDSKTYQQIVLYDHIVR